MSRYIVGDLQGCLDPLRRLLDEVKFSTGSDQLLCVGDLINRGPQSADTLRFLKTLGGSAEAVLGNHDLHLLAVRYGNHSLGASDTLSDLLAAPDSDELCEWLRMRPMLIEDPDERYLVVHAGIPHVWDRATAIACARELETAIQGVNHTRYFQVMYGDHPTMWHQGLSGMERLRVITNYLSRMRIVDNEGRLELSYKDKPDKLPKGYFPWFERRHSDWQGYRFFFGHWASLEGKTTTDWAKALDTGYVWGRSMCLYCLEDKRRLYCEHSGKMQWMEDG